MVGIEVRAGFIGSIQPTERSQGNNPSVAGTSNPVQGSGLVWRQWIPDKLCGFYGAGEIQNVLPEKGDRPL